VNASIAQIEPDPVQMSWWGIVATGCITRAFVHGAKSVPAVQIGAVASPRGGRADGDVTAEFERALDMRERKELELVGSVGTLRLLDPWRGWRSRIELEQEGGIEILPQPSTDPYALELQDLTEAIQTGRPPLLARSDAVGQARAIEALNRATRTGGPIELFC
jgi:hypothetical protein